MSHHADPNLQWASALVDGLVDAGVQQVVISPGSRSTPLVLACRDQPALRIHRHLDERCAAFMALGMARGSGRPVALVCTSGSAPTHWHPAVVEAHHSGLPLILLSADRPSELQDCGANQTIDQHRLFGSAVRAFHALSAPDPLRPCSPDLLREVRARATRAVNQACGSRPGPVHINVPFREPLVTQARMSGKDKNVLSEARTPPAPQIHIDVAQLERLLKLLNAGPGLIICGPGDQSTEFHHTVTTLAAGLNCPVLADPLSGLRFGPHDLTRVMSRYDSYLRTDELADQLQPRWVLRFGAMPVSRALSDALLAMTDAQHILVDPTGSWPDPLHISTERICATPHYLCQALCALPLNAAADEWLARFRSAEQQFIQLQQTISTAVWFEAGLVQQLLTALPAGSLLFSGNSMPIRELDSFSGSDAKPLRILANRGTSGIDGNISTLLGLASVQGDSCCVGLIGDLAFCHDMNGLLAAEGRRATLVVINNGGGGIFRYLPQAGLDGFEDDWLMPTGLDIQQVARLYRLPFYRADNAGDFAEALRECLPAPGVKIIEAVINPEHSLQQHQALWAAASRR